MPIADPMAMMMPPVMAVMMVAPMMVPSGGRFDRRDHRRKGEGNCSDKR